MTDPVLVADLSHWTWDGGANVDFRRARAAGMIGVIYKASQGATYRDPTYQKSRRAAKDAGLLWGAYHFGTAAAVDAQISNFLLAAGVSDEDFIAVDFELNEQSPENSMSKEQLLAFIHGTEAKLGRPMTIYTGSRMYDVYGPSAARELAQHRVWWARYADQPQVHPTWPTYWLWQYTNGHHGSTPRQVDGLGYCDCNRYAGDEASLRASWSG